MDHAEVWKLSLHLDEHGAIDEFVVMVRPLSGALALAEAMKAQLAHQRALGLGGDPVQGIDSGIARDQDLARGRRSRVLPFFKPMPKSKTAPRKPRRSATRACRPRS